MLKKKTNLINTKQLIVSYYVEDYLSLLGIINYFKSLNYYSQNFQKSTYLIHF